MPKFKQYSANGIVCQEDKQVHFRRFCSPDKAAESEVQETYEKEESKCKLFTFEDEEGKKVYEFFIDGVFIGDALL